VIDGTATVAMVGLGGYGNIYVKALLETDTAARLQFVAGIDPFPQGCQHLEEIHRRNIPVFSSMEEFFRCGRADLVILSTPLQLHCEQAKLALEAGAHVLCEKPLGGHPRQVQEMVQARDRSRRQLAIGYQWSFSPAIQNLKSDISAGRFGRPRRLRTRVYWPRDEKYYTRSGWAGRQRDAEGRWVLDSPANNACAHYLHNMFYVLGETADRSDWPASVQAELYRANAIENYDTAVIRSRTQRGAEVLLATSHATLEECDPIFCYEFEQATIHYGKFGDAIVAQLSDGSQIDYGSPISSERPDKLFDVLQSIRSSAPVACGPEAAGAQTACIFAAQQSMPRIVDFDGDLVCAQETADSRRIYVRGLAQILDRCYEQMRLPSELGIEWSTSGREITVDGVPPGRAARLNARVEV
jgi:predicted dehydrogenase